MSEGSLQQRFADSMGQLLGPGFPSDIGLAVSGGGDSMAMLYLAHDWARIFGVRLWVVTVDHGLRPESADEAAMVADACRDLGWPHATLRWHWDGRGNLQAEARKARLALIDSWRGDLRHVLMAHTKDDMAETFLMRLKRGSGVEGLSAMAPLRPVTASPWGSAPLPAEELSGDAPLSASPGLAQPFQIVRPLLAERRAALRFHLGVLKVRYVDDPTNLDPAYERVKARALLERLEAEGLGTETLTATAMRLARARDALTARARDVAARVVQEGRSGGEPTGCLIFDRDGLAGVERDTQLRLLAAALQWVASAEYRPRAAALEDLLDRLLSGASGTLHGCEARTERARIRIFREYGALGDLSVPVGQPWDERWCLRHEAAAGKKVRALGETGWTQIAGTPEDSPPFHAARSLPAVFDGDTLVSCPALGFGTPYVVEFRPRGGCFDTFLLSH